MSFHAVDALLSPFCADILFLDSNCHTSKASIELLCETESATRLYVFSSLCRKTQAENLCSPHWVSAGQACSCEKQWGTGVKAAGHKQVLTKKQTVSKCNFAQSIDAANSNLKPEWGCRMISKKPSFIAVLLEVCTLTAALYQREKCFLHFWSWRTCDECAFGTLAS